MPGDSTFVPPKRCYGCVPCTQLKCVSSAGTSPFGGGLDDRGCWLTLAKKQLEGKEVVYRMEGKTESIRPEKGRRSRKPR